MVGQTSRTVLGKLGLAALLILGLGFAFVLYELLSIIVFGTATGATILSPLLQSLGAAISLKH